MDYKRLCRFLGWVHLAYLGLLPVLTTFAVLFDHGNSYMFLVFLGGVIAVSVYLAVVSSYTPFPESVTAAVFLLVDGPVFAIMGQLGGRDPVSLMVNSFMVDGVAVWLAIAWLASKTSKPSREQRIATQAFALAAIAAMILIFWPYLKDSMAEDWTRILWLVAGVVEGVGARFFLLKHEKVARSEGISAVYVGVFLFLWIVAMSAGNVLHQILGK